MIARHLRPFRGASAGMTLLEVMVSVGILAMISLLIYGAFDSLSRGKKGEGIKAERARQGRAAVLRMSRELASAYLSLHTPNNPAIVTRQTHFIGKNSMNFDRVDFVSFAHRRINQGAKESDQAEIGYFVVPDPEDSDKKDLVRRVQAPPDNEPQRGGIIQVLAEDIESFDLQYFDAQTGQWVERWDTTQASGQPGRVPFEVKITLTLANVPSGVPKTYMTKARLAIETPLTFGIPR